MGIYFNWNRTLETLHWKMKRRLFFTKISTFLAALCWFKHKEQETLNLFHGLENKWVRRRLKPGHINKTHENLEFENYIGECHWKERLDVEELFPMLVQRSMQLQEFPGNDLVRFKEFENPIIFTYRVDNDSHQCILIKTEFDA
jgi:hypothetical protein